MTGATFAAQPSIAWLGRREMRLRCGRIAWCSAAAAATLMLVACSEPPADLRALEVSASTSAIQGERAVAQFELVVEGADPIDLLGAEKSCGCSRVEVAPVGGGGGGWSWDPTSGGTAPRLMPGSRARVRVWIDTSRREGTLDVIVTLHHSGSSRKLSLSTRVRILDTFVVDPPMLDYDELCRSRGGAFLGSIIPRQPGDRVLEIVAVPVGWRVETQKVWHEDRASWLARVTWDHSSRPLATEQEDAILLTDGGSGMTRWRVRVSAAQWKPAPAVVGLEPTASGELHARIALVPGSERAAADAPVVRLGEWSVDCRGIRFALEPVGGGYVLNLTVPAAAVTTSASGFISGEVLIHGSEPCSGGSRVLVAGRL